MKRHDSFSEIEEIKNDPSPTILEEAIATDTAHNHRQKEDVLPTNRKLFSDDSIIEIREGGEGDVATIKSPQLDRKPLPKDWELLVAGMIAFTFSGLCAGGVATSKTDDEKHAFEGVAGGLFASSLVSFMKFLYNRIREPKTKIEMSKRAAIQTNRIEEIFEKTKDYLEEGKTNEEIFENLEKKLTEFIEDGGIDEPPSLSHHRLETPKRASLQESSPKSSFKDNSPTIIEVQNTSLKTNSSELSPSGENNDFFQSMFETISTLISPQKKPSTDTRPSSVTSLSPDSDRKL